MREAIKSGPRPWGRFSKTAGVALVLLGFAALPVFAQINGIAPSVTSLGFGGRGVPHAPNIAPSVTSLGPRGFGNPGYRPYGPGSLGRHGRGYGYVGWGYAMPYYIPYDSTYAYDYVGRNGYYGPDVYQGPDPAQQPTLHIVVEQGPNRGNVSASADGDPPAAPAQAAKEPQSEPAEDAKQVEPTVLVFRDGHQQEVTNYAIMGQTVWVFDKRVQKIALADLDVKATVRANDARGIAFQMPAKKS